MRGKCVDNRDLAGLSRREFSKILAVGAASATLPVAAIASSGARDGGLTLDIPDLSVEAGAQYKVLVSKYGARLSEEQKTDVRRLIDQGLKSIVTLRSFQLDNSDEPANVFRARIEN